MSKSIAEQNIERLKVGRLIEEDSPFCLSQVMDQPVSDPDINDKVIELIDGRIDDDRSAKGRIERSCNIGICTLRIIDGPQGRKREGACMAATYCLKREFEAVGQAPTVDEGRALYRVIIANLDGAHDEYNAGNFCPRVNCELSAGVSIDGSPGTAGECEMGSDTGYTQLELS